MPFDKFFPVSQEVVQYGVETTPGTKVAATKKFQALQFDFHPKKPTQEVRQQGNRFVVDHAPAKGSTPFNVKAEACEVQDLIVLLSTMLVNPSFSVVGETVYSATCAPDSFGGNVLKTLTLEKGQAGSGNAANCGYAALDSLEIVFTPDKAVSMSGAGFAQNLDYGQDLTGGLTSLGKSALFSTQVDVFIATSEAGLSAGQVNPMSCKLKFGKFASEVYTLVSDDESYSQLTLPMGSIQYDLVFPKGDLANGFISAIDLNTQYYIEVIAKGAEIESSLFDQVRFRSPIKFMNPDEGSEQDIMTESLTANAIHVDDFNTDGGAILFVGQSFLSSL